jgi:tetratricopeptide (TPR) repeat protein
MPENREFASTRQASAVAVAALAAECGLMPYYLADGLVWIALTAHIAISLALSGWWYLSSAARADIRLPMLLTVSTTALGPVGAAGTLVTIVLARWYGRNALPFEEWYQSLFPDSEQDENAETLNRIADAESQNGGSVSAFTDVLAFGSLPQKQSLIALIGSGFRPLFGPVLKKALLDNNNAIRVQAGAAMNKLENAILDRTLELTGRIRENTGDAEAHRSLARHYDDYLYSGLLDSKRADEIREQALAAYRYCVIQAAGDLESWLAVGRLLVRGKRYGEAAEWLERAFEAGLSTSEASLWYMESLFHLGRFDKLRHLAHDRHQSFGSEGGLPANALETVRLWADA